MNWRLPVRDCASWSALNRRFPHVQIGMFFVEGLMVRLTYCKAQAKLEGRLKDMTIHALEILLGAV